MNIAKSIKKLEYNFEIHTEKFLWHHRVLGFLAAFIGLPLMILVCVFATTIAVICPIAMLLGWL